MNHHLITLMILSPFVGSVIQAFFPSTSRWIALISSLIASLCAIVVTALIKVHTSDLQMREVYPWIGSYAINYDVAADGLNALLILLVAVVFPVLIASEWNQKAGVRGMHGLLLILQSTLLGAVSAQDLFLLFFFWAMSAIPFYFLIGIWGGEKCEAAAFRSIVAASIGNALFFAALVIIYYSIDPHTFSLRELMGGKLTGRTFPILGHTVPVSTVAFVLVGFGLALRAPIWPLHGWFNQVAEAAPPSVFVALCGVAIPVAAYIFIRLSYSLFPETVAMLSTQIVMIGSLNLIVGGLCALAQRGLRLLLAFICLSEMGLILIGVGSLNSAAAVGSIFQLLTVGLGLSGFGLFIGIINERTGKVYFINKEGGLNFGGIANQAPWISLFAGIVIVSLLGLPGVAGFVGHALLLIGAYDVHPVTLGLIGSALLLMVYYLFTMYKYVFFGRAQAGSRVFYDLTVRERLYFLPLALGLLVFGVFPRPLLEIVRPTVLTLLSLVK